MKFLVLLLTPLFVLAGSVAPLQAHCQIPCGIFHDELRLALIREHIETIEKSMQMIRKLSQAEARDENQIVRWVNNKEDHAAKIQEIVCAYFLAQRVKIVEPGNEAGRKEYLARLETLHRMLVAAMKTRQSLDEGLIKQLRDLCDQLADHFPGPKEHRH